MLGLLAEGPCEHNSGLSCLPISAVSTVFNGPDVCTGLRGSSEMAAMWLGVIGLLVEVSCWLTSAVSSSCTDVTEALFPRTASNTAKYGKSPGIFDSSSDSHPVTLLLSLSTICLYLFFNAFTFPLHCEPRQY